MSSVEFVWKHGGGHVLLAGSFSQWQGLPMSFNGHWQETLNLEPGQYSYKFIVDGNWRYDHHKPVTADGHGNINNLLIVGEGQHVPSHDIKTQPPKKVEVPSQNIKPQPPKQEEKKPENKGKPEEKKKEDIKGKPEDNKGKPQDKNQQAKKKEDNKGKPEDNKGKPQDKNQQAKKKEDNKGKPEDNKGKSQDNKGKPQDNKGKPEDKNKEDNKGKPQDKKDQQGKKKEEDPGRLVGHWEKIYVNSITGKESWWVFVKSDDDPAKFPLRRRIPPDCVHCGSTVLVEDEVFARYGVEWQPLCIKCYDNRIYIPLINGKNRPNSKPICHWCLETEDVTNDICPYCKDFVTQQKANFGLSNNEALTSLYYYQTALRNSRRSLLHAI